MDTVLLMDISVRCELKLDCSIRVCTVLFKNGMETLIADGVQLIMNLERILVHMCQWSCRCLCKVFL